MVSTTDNEYAKEQPKREAPKQNETREEQVKRLYNEGRHLYDIAAIVYDFHGEEQIERVRQILGIMQPPENRLMDEE